MYDLIVVGGGLSGCSAALSAARHNMNVLIIEKSGFLGGAPGNCYVNPFMPYHVMIDGKRELISAGIFKEVLDGLKALDGFSDNEETFNEEMLKLLLDRMTSKESIKVLFHSFLVSVENENDTIKSVTVANKSGMQTYSARYFIDCTGDADLTALAGCSYRVGRDSDNLCQPMTLCFRISGINREEVWNESLKIQKIYNEHLESGKISIPRQNVLMFDHMDSHIMHFNSTRIIKKSPLDVFDISEAEKMAREQAYELYMFLKNNSESFKNSILLSCAPQIGVRESRLIDGEYILTQEDLIACTKFDDGIAAGNYDIDIHSPDGIGTSHYYFKPDEYYTIPYRCLIPKGMKNLLVAGRCISATHEAQASVRIMPICTTTGQAAGTAVAVANESGLAVYDADVSEIQKILKEDGAFF